MPEAADHLLWEQALALKGSIRLLADHSERSVDERHDLAEFAVDLVDRMFHGEDNGSA